MSSAGNTWAYYSFYRFLVDPANRLDAVLLVALYLAGPLALLLAVLIRNGRRGIDAVLARPIYTLSPVLVFAAAPAAGAYVVCAALLGTGEAESWFTRVNNCTSDLIFFPVLALWPMLALVALAIEAEARNSRALRLAYIGAFLTSAAVVFGGHRYLWSERVFVSPYYVIDAPLVLLVGNLAAAAILPGMLVGWLASRLFGNVDEAVVEETPGGNGDGNGDGAQVRNHRSSDGRDGVEEGLRPHGSFIAKRKRWPLPAALVAALVAALGLSTMRLRSVYRTWVSYTSAEVLVALYAGGDIWEAASHEGRAWSPLGGWMTLKDLMWDPLGLMQDSEQAREPFAEAVSMLRARAPLATPFLLVGDASRYSLYRNREQPWCDTVYADMWFAWLAADFNVAGLTVTLVDGQGNVTRTISHPCLDDASAREEQYWLKYAERYRTLLHREGIPLVFTDSEAVFDDAERAWRGAAPVKRGVWPQHRPVFVVPLDNEVARVRMQLYTFEGETTSAVEMDVHGVLRCIEAASGSPEALKALFGGNGQDRSADGLARGLARAGVFDCEFVRDGYSIPAHNVDADDVRRWLKENEGRVRWDAERRIWTTEDKRSDPSP